MDKEKFKTKILQQSKELAITISDAQIEQLYIYNQTLLEWNEKINITAITLPEEVINKHFIDSLTISKVIKDNSKIIDIGTGGGFPGIPLKIVNNTLNVTLLDSINKRINFLKEVISIINISNTTAIHGRAEELGQQDIYRETYDVAVSRAVAPLNVLLEYMMPFVKVGGICICMKGLNIEEELNDAKKAIQFLGGEIERIDNLLLPETEMTRNNIIIKKVKNTPKVYPRKAGMPSKEPII